MKTLTIFISLLAILTSINTINRVHLFNAPSQGQSNYQNYQHEDQTTTNQPSAKQTPSGLVDLSDHYYKNNLKAQNWYYGSTSLDKYKMRLFNDATKFNLTFCPFQLPFVSKDVKTCFNCPPEKPLYNLGDSACQMCPYQHYFDQLQGNCTPGTPPIKIQDKDKTKIVGVTELLNQEPSNKNPNGQANKTDNTGCLESQVYNVSSKICQKKIYVINQRAQRIILPSAQFMTQESQKIRKNNAAELVFGCPPQKPYLKDQTCINCPPFQYFKMLGQECVKDCEIYTIYDEKTKLCVNATFLTSPSSANLIASITPFQSFAKKIQTIKAQKPFTKYCPETAPYFVDNKCTFCSGGTPYFDIDAQKCVDCAEGRWYDSTKKKCINDSKDGLSIERMVMNIL